MIRRYLYNNRFEFQKTRFYMQVAGYYIKDIHLIRNAVDFNADVSIMVLSNGFETRNVP